jgi:alanine-glyoxylate transaminase/serine-glyoxylate transaminase/serine-pyruvate transaminase
MDRGSIDFNDAEFVEVYQAAYDGVKRVLGTRHHLFLYNASGHGAWEASLANLFSPGDTVLVVESGYFSDEWAAMGKAFGLTVQVLPADWRHGAYIADVQAALAADTAHRIKGVCVVHNETSTGMMIPLPAIRTALDAEKHPALFLVDTISSLGSLPFRMDEWGIDCVVGGSQKGLMLPTGMSFTGVSDKALAAHRQARLPRFYFDWTKMEARAHRSFIGTIPTAMFYGLRESVRLIEEEGLDALIDRHRRLGEATRRAVAAWTANDGPQLFCTNPERFSDSVTAVLVPEGRNGDALRKTIRDRFNVSLGGGLGKLGGKVFRIGHLGDLNEPMLLGALAAVEMGLRLEGIPHRAGGVDAAMTYLAGD